ncbi:MAG: RNA-binding domain-containing protein [Halobacteriota archaeon]
MLNKNIRMEESQRIEFKKSLAERKELLETISAFANSKGGQIFVGIEENKDGSVKEIVGIRIKGKEIENLSNEIKQNTDPVIFPSIEVKGIKGKSVLVIEVKESRVKPVFVKIDKIPVAFKRVGKTNQKIDVNELRRIISEGSEFLWDSQVCEEASLDDIDWAKVRWFLRKAKRERNLDIDSEISVKEALERLNLTKNGKLTNAAILVFGKEPLKFFLQGEVRCAKFKGTKAVKPFIDMKVIQGSSYEQIDAAEKFVLNNIRKAAWTVSGQVEREERWEYPPDAIREGITNAVAHRDYSSTANVHVSIFDDRIEVWNPGTLPEPLTPEDLKKEHKSIPINPLIAHALFLIKYIERWGTGTNDIIRYCVNSGLPEPVFKEEAGGFAVVLRKSKIPELSELELNERQKKAIEYIKEHGRVTNREYQILCPMVTRETLRKDLNDLITKKIIVKRGFRRGVFYEFI